MTQRYDKGEWNRYGGRVHRALIVGLAFAALVLQAGCWTGTEFRSTAIPAVRAGVSQIVDGLLNGLFAAIEPEGTSGSDSSDTPGTQ